MQKKLNKNLLLNDFSIFLYFAFFFGLISFLYIIDNKQDWGDDFAQYILHAKNILYGRNYNFLLNNEPFIGFLFPILILPTYFFFKINFFFYGAFQNLLWSTQILIFFIFFVKNQLTKTGTIIFFLLCLLVPKIIYFQQFIFPNISVNLIIIVCIISALKNSNNFLLKLTYLTLIFSRYDGLAMYIAIALYSYIKKIKNYYFYSSLVAIISIPLSDIFLSSYYNMPSYLISFLETPASILKSKENNLLNFFFTNYIPNFVNFFIAIPEIAIFNYFIEYSENSTIIKILLLCIVYFSLFLFLVSFFYEIKKRNILAYFFFIYLLYVSFIKIVDHRYIFVLYPIFVYFILKLLDNFSIKPYFYFLLSIFYLINIYYSILDAKVIIKNTNFFNKNIYEIVNNINDKQDKIYIAFIKPRVLNLILDENYKLKNVESFSIRDENISSTKYKSGTYLLFYKKKVYNQDKIFEKINLKYKIKKINENSEYKLFIIL